MYQLKMLLSVLVTCSMFFLIAGCLCEEERSSYLDVEVCKDGVVLKAEACRVMYDDSVLFISKIHTLEGADKVLIFNASSDKRLLLSDCKLKGFNVTRDSISLICYFHESNIASGRNLSASENLDYILMDKNTLAFINNEAINIGGIDSELIRVKSNSRHVYCSKGKCIEILSGETPHYENIVEFENKKILEVIELSAHKLGLLTFDGQSYFLSEVFKGVEAEKKVVGGASYNLHFDGVQLGVTRILNRSDMIDSFIFDYERFDKTSGLTWGESNMEGRVAWAAFYYWGAFSYLSSVSSAWQSSQIETRLMQELELAFPIGIDLSSRVISKRYSLNRTPILFMMHSGRILTALNLIKKHTKYNVLGYIARLEGLINSGGFNEEFDSGRSLYDPEFFGEGSAAGWFYLRKGIDFWADGLPLPFNFVSAICTEQYGFSVLEGYCDEALSYLELEVRYSKGEQWRYWPSEVANVGYSEADEVSINTPVWGGNNNAIAHESYLSMDAIALINRKKNDVVSEFIVPMIANGKLNLDAAPYLGESNMRKVCESPAIKNMSYLSHFDGYEAYDFYQRSIKIYILDKCHELLSRNENSFSLGVFN